MASSREHDTQDTGEPPRKKRKIESAAPTATIQRTLSSFFLSPAKHPSLAPKSTEEGSTLSNQDILVEQENKDSDVAVQSDVATQKKPLQSLKIVSSRKRLDSRDFFRKDGTSLAKALLGRTLVRILSDGTRLSGKIVEVKAYLGVPDKGAHSYGGRKTEKNKSMFLDAGYAYVYNIYKVHYCFNITSDCEGVPTASLIRALEPLEGKDRMRAHRQAKSNGSSARRLSERELCSGPAKLCQALDIDRSRHDGIDLTASTELWLEEGEEVDERNIVSSPRIGIEYAEEWADKPLRFTIKGSPYVSVKPPSEASK